MNNEKFTDTEWKTIDAGIGKIEYEEPTNFLLSELMDNLEKAIQNTNPKKVNEVLQSIN
jgi:hypothetical protein